MTVKTLSYADSGVNIETGSALVEAIKPIARSTERPGADARIGAFGGLFDLRAAGYQDPVLVAANDGVGTKLRIAIESGLHNTVGIDLVAMCVNDLITLGAEPLFFLDYFATAELDVKQATNVVAGIARGCKEAGCALIGGESAEMPGIYARGDYDLAGFAVGAVERNRLLSSDKIKQGDVILGIASCGAHSNGFSLIRKIVENEGLGWHDPAPFNKGANRSLAQALLEPTRIYVKSLLAILSQTNAIRALAHVTGGGIVENIPRALPDNLIAKIDLSKIEIPEVFGWLKIIGGISESEMLRTFNCGIGMAAIVDCEQAKTIQTSLEEAGEQIFVIGEVASRTGNEAIIYENNLNF